MTTQTGRVLGWLTHNSSPSRVVAVSASTAAVLCSAIAVWSSLHFAAVPVAEAAGRLDGGALARAWARWDSGWYASIARYGYSYAPGLQGPVAFFPGYPVAVRALTSLGLDRFTAGFIVTLLCGMLACWLFVRWAETRSDSKTALVASLLLILYPFALYLYGAMYSDALLLALVVGAFLCLERNQLVAATLLGAAATFTRPVAPAVVLGLWIRQLERRYEQHSPLRWIDFLPLLAAGGLGLYMVYLWRQFGDPLAFIHVQSAPGWDQPPGWQTWLKVTWFQILFPRVAPLVAIRLVGHAFVALGALALVPATRRHLGWGYAVYVALAVGLPTISSKDFMGLGRYVLSAFPVFLTLAMLMRGKPKLIEGWLAISGLTLALLALAWGAGGYVA
jgi:hypothetical protein